MLNCDVLIFFLFFGFLNFIIEVYKTAQTTLFSKYADGLLHKSYTSQTASSTTQNKGVRKMTVKLKCPVCGDYGVLMLKTTITKTTRRQYRYEKWYVYHNRSKGSKQRWCYLSEKYLELPEIKEAIQREQATQNSPIATQNRPTTTQSRVHAEKPSSSFINENKPLSCKHRWGRRLAWSRL